MITIGASEVPVVLGLQRRHDDGEPYCSEIELWARLSGLVPRYDTRPSGPDAEIGHWMEPVIGARYAAEVGVPVVPGPPLDQPGYSAPDLPWLHVRPDFLVPALNRVLEAKSPRVLHPDRWGASGTDQVPPEYAVQVMAQLAVAYRLWGTEAADLAAFARAPGWGDSRVWAVFHLTRDPETERGILAAVERWVGDHVVDGAPPIPDGSASAARTLRRIWGTAEGETRIADATDVELYRRLVSTRALLDELRDRVEQARQLLEVSMGVATELVTTDGQLLATWRPNKHGVRQFRTKFDPFQTETEAA